MSVDKKRKHLSDNQTNKNILRNPNIKHGHWDLFAVHVSWALNLNDKWANRKRLKVCVQLDFLDPTCAEVLAVQCDLSQEGGTLTGGVVRDLLCHKTHAVGRRPGNWSLWYRLLKGGREEKIENRWITYRLFHVTAVHNRKNTSLWLWKQFKNKMCGTTGSNWSINKKVTSSNAKLTYC